MTTYVHSAIPGWLKLERFGLLWEEPRELRFRWGSIGLGRNAELSVSHLLDDDRAWLSAAVLGLGVSIRLWRGSARRGDSKSYGLCLGDHALHLMWGSWRKLWWLPWDWEHVKAEVWTANGWAPMGKPWLGEDDGRLVEGHPYRYTLESGQVQHVTATIHVERREWRWRWMQFSPWPRKVSTCIDVQFSDEVGEMTGSWKGGTVGCGYEMRPGETARETLKRMERDRKF